MRGKGGVRRLRKKVEPPTITKTIQPFLDYWEEQEGLRKHQRNSKSFQTAIRNLKRLVSFGTAFKDKPELADYQNIKFDFIQWKTSIDNYVKSRSPGYLPYNKSWMNGIGFGDFIYHSYHKTSFFIQFLENPPEPLVEDRYPKITQSLVEQFTKWIPTYKPTDKDMGKFIMAGNRIGKYFIEHKNKIASHFLPLLPSKQAQLLIRAVKKATEDKGWVITPGHLCSNDTFTTRLPTYLKNQAIFSSVDRKRFR